MLLQVQLLKIQFQIRRERQDGPLGNLASSSALLKTSRVSNRTDNNPYTLVSRTFKIQITTFLYPIGGCETESAKIL